MAVPYYDQTKVKLDLRITDTALDTELDNWNDEAEAEIDDLLVDVATKNRRITALPVLLFVAGSVPESVQSAADYFVKQKYYEYSKSLTLSSSMNSEAIKKIQKYIEGLNIDKVIYYRIAR